MFSLSRISYFQLSVFCIFVFSVFFVLPVSALEIGQGLLNSAANSAGYDPNTTETSFASTLGIVIKGLLSFVGIIFLSLMVYAGFLWMTARGNEEPVTKAKDIIRASIIGLIITLAAYSITNFIVPMLVEKAASGEATVGDSVSTVPTNS